MHSTRRFLTCAIVSGAFVVASVGERSVAVGADAAQLPPPKEIATEISDAEIRLIAEAKGISFDTQRWLMNEGAVALVGLQERFAEDPDFGGLWVDYSPFVVRVRLVGDNLAIRQAISSTLVGVEPIEVIIDDDSLSASDFRRTTEQVAHLIRDAEGLWSLEPEVRSGRVTIRSDIPNQKAMHDAAALQGVEVRAESPEVDTAANWAGALWNGWNGAGDCTVGYTLRRLSDNQPGVATAGHCGVVGDVNGYALWPEEQEVCPNANGDRQVHPMDGGSTYAYFPTYTGPLAWIYNLAGGYFVGQDVYRYGQRTKELNTISDVLKLYPASAGSDCPTAGNIYGWNLAGSTRTAGSQAEGGDSGGPVLLAYGGNWYLAGLTRGYTGSNTRVSVLVVPSGWKACYLYNC